MDFFYFIIFFIFGLTIGSFLNSVIYRLQKGEIFPSGRSYCPNCKERLSWSDLIPVLSFLILKGKCRYCQKPISLQYPLVELTTGVLFALIAKVEPVFTLSQLIATLYLFIICSLLIIIFVYDLKRYIIPDKIIYPAILISLIFNFQFLIPKQLPILSNLILSALGSAAFFLIIVMISKGNWMGGGDIKLAFFMGLFLGFPNILVALFSAFFLGAIIGLGLILAGKKTMRSEIPFGPFLVTGTFIAFFWGEEIITWYLRLLV